MEEHAIESLAKVIERFPGNADLLRRVLRVAYATGGYAAAAEQLTKYADGPLEVGNRVVDEKAVIPG